MWYPHQDRGGKVGARSEVSFLGVTCQCDLCGGPSRPDMHAGIKQKYVCHERESHMIEKKGGCRALHAIPFQESSSVLVPEDNNPQAEGGW